IANIAITLIYQEDVILRKYLDHIKEDFIKQGGIREQMTRARIEYRNKQ
ncbi:MAG: four helix bundle protein, partial [Prevotella sp.]|nr:four helix bundle protein [Prevotella sp.]